MYNRWLCHYGVKGMKWGVRKKRTSYSDYYHVLSSLSQKERDQYDGHDYGDSEYNGKSARKRERSDTKFYKSLEKKYSKKNKQRYLEDRFSVSYVDKNGKAMGFLIGQDSKMWHDQERYINVAIAITKKYQGTHVSTRLVDEGKKWFEKHPEYSEMRWYAVGSNVRSQKLAEKSGFERANQYDEHGDVVYRYTRKT